MAYVIVILLQYCYEICIPLPAKQPTKNPTSIYTPITMREQLPSSPLWMKARDATPPPE